MKPSALYDNLSRGQSPDVFGRWMLLPTEKAAADGELGDFNHALGYVVRGGVSLVGYRGKDNRTLFDAAALGGNANIVSILLERGAQPDVSVVSCASGKSALYLATSLKNEEVAKRLILGGADVSFRCVKEECDVLLKALRLGLCVLLPLLLGAGATANTRGRRGVTPLHVSAEMGFGDVACILLANGAEKDALDDDGESPVLYAANKSHFDVVEMLVRQGVRLDVRNSTGRSLLHLLSMSGQVGLVELLLNKGVDIEEACLSGRTPLVFAAYHGQAGVTELLLKRGANRNVTLRGRTPFTHAIIKGRRKVVQAFVENGENVSGDSPFLRMAVGQDQAGSIFALVKGGADMEKTDGNGYTPLMYSVCKPPGYKLSALTCLLRLGADVSCTTPEHKRTPLHVVCHSQRPGFVDAVNILLRRGADETICDGDGRTPLQFLDRGHGFAGDKERARALLTRAPQDRVWRRRGWLVMARCRRGLLEMAREDGAGVGESAPKVLRVQHSDQVGTDFVKAVEFLTGPAVDGVFRTVLKFL